MKVLLVDNFDSFTFNLFHLLEGLGANVKVVRNDAVHDVDLQWCDKIILSPGPGVPSSAIGMNKVISRVFDKKPILGVCLGMQALAEFFSDSIYNLSKVYHGVQENIKLLNKSELFVGLEGVQAVGLYHSWAVRLESNSCFKPLAISNDSILMAMKHSDLPIYGIQFHPESILTKNGRKILNNFLEL